MALNLSNLNRLTIKNVFMIHQKPNSKIDVEGFDNILKMIDFKMKDEQKQKVIKNLFRYKQEINFDEFLKIFELDLDKYTPVDVKNAFKVLAKDDDTHVEMSIIEDIVKDLEIEENEKKFLMNHLSQFNDRQGQFNFVELLKLFGMQLILNSNNNDTIIFSLLQYNQLKQDLDDMWNDIPDNNFQQQFENLQQQIEQGFQNKFDNNFEKQFDHLFNIWQQQFEEDYQNQEKHYRKQIFKKNVTKIINHNKKPKKYKMNLNQFATLTDEEFQKYYLMKPLKIKPQSKERKLFEDDITQILSNLPASQDWSNYLTPIKHQKSCQACYAFSAIAALEAQMKIYYNISFDFSEQEIIDCSQEYSNNGCEGGQPEYVYDYIQENGVNLEENYQYKEKQQSQCSKIQNENVFRLLKGHIKPDPNVISILQFLQLGPLVVNHYVPDDFRYYFSGIFDTNDCHHEMEINHSSIIVGYNFQDSTPYFLLKNSWGDKWGMKGFYKVKIGELSRENPGFCFLANNGYNVFPLIDTITLNQLIFIYQFVYQAIYINIFFNWFIKFFILLQNIFLLFISHYKIYIFVQKFIFLDILGCKQIT